ncbi:MAG TPA: hypothetical protein VGM08_04815 [Candidatus Saccharimonadales bacterium]|jgi:hypothetical protein
MSPKTQKIVGVVLILLAFGAVGLQIAEHQDVLSLVALFLGAAGGQQIGQGNARGKHQQ